MGKTSKPRTTKKERKSTYEKKLSINGSFEDVIKASFKKENKVPKKDK